MSLLLLDSFFLFRPISFYFSHWCCLLCSIAGHSKLSPIALTPCPMSRNTNNILSGGCEPISYVIIPYVHTWSSYPSLAIIGVPAFIPMEARLALNFLYSLASFYADLVLGLFLRRKGTKKSGKRDVNWKAKGIGREVSKWKGDVKVWEWSPLKKAPATLNDT